MLLMQAGDSLTNVLRRCQCIVIVWWWIGLLHLRLPNAIRLPYQRKPSGNHCLSSLSATRVTTLWLKQPTCFCSDIYIYTTLVIWYWERFTFLATSNPLPMLYSIATVLEQGLLKLKVMKFYDNIQQLTFYIARFRVTYTCSCRENNIMKIIIHHS